MAVPQILVDLYAQCKKNKTEFFMAKLEDPEYKPGDIDTIKTDIDLELQATINDAAALKKVLP